MISAVAQTDPGFASAFVQLVLDMAGLDSRHQANVQRMGTAPAEVACLSEHSVYDEYDLRLGRVDLRFDADEDFTLFIENKLFTGFGPDQLERYHEALQALPEGRVRSGLVAVTRDVPTAGELEAGTDGWLGAARWARLYDAGLATLPIDDPDLAVQWRLLVNIMHDQGDLGVTAVDTDLIIAWSRWAEGREHLITILGDVRSRALEMLRDRLKAKHRGQGLRDALADQHHQGTREDAPYKRATQSVSTSFRVPARVNHAAVFLVFWVLDSGQPVFSVEAHPWRAAERLADGEPQLKRAARKLANAGVKGELYGGEYVWWREHKADEFLHEPDVPARLLELIEADISTLVDSGVFAGDFAAAVLRGRKAPPKVAKK